jgi:hypothetical protein
VIEQPTDFRWDMFRLGLHHLKSVALIMLYEVAAFKSLVIPEVTRRGVYFCEIGLLTSAM